MNERDRFDSLLAVLDALVEANESTPILVEGKRDVAALRSLGCTGDVLPVNNGQPIFTVAENLSRRVGEVIVLTDWDRRGHTLVDQLSTGLAANGVRADLTFRDRIGDCNTAKLKDVESLLPHVRRGLLRFHRTSIEDRRQAAGLLG